MNNTIQKQRTLSAGVLFNRFMLTRLTLILTNILFLLTPISLAGHYTDTAFMGFSVVLAFIVVSQRVKRMKHLLGTGFFALFSIVGCYVVGQDLNFTKWGKVKKGIVDSIEQQNQNSDYTTTVYYQYNENNETEPEECRYWEQKAYNAFPFFEWLIKEDVNCCGEIKATNAASW